MFLEKNGVQYGGRKAIISDKGEYITYDELEEKSKELAKIIEKRSVIFILCDYDIESVSFYYQVMSIDVVPVLLEKKIDLELLNDLIEIYHPQYLWVDNKRFKNFEQYDRILQCNEHGLLKTGYPNYHIDSELALLLTTSGSTGSPKLVRLSYKNLCDNADAIVKALALEVDDRGITTLPMNYTYGLSVCHMHWRMGATMIVTNFGLLDTKFWQAFENFGATNFAGVPYSYEILDKIAFLNRGNYGKLKFITEAGGKLSLELQEKFGEKFNGSGIRFYILYGQTEGTTVLTHIPFNMVMKKMGSIGIPLDGVYAQIDNAYKGEGELVVSGTSVSMGYAECSEDLYKSKKNNNGVLHTGDIVKIDEDGYLYISGRIKRFVKMLGIRMNLDDVEAIIKKHFVDIDCACAGKDNEIEIYYSGNCVEDEILNYISNILKINKKMIKVKKINIIPRNESGKISYMNLK